MHLIALITPRAPRDLRAAGGARPGTMVALDASMLLPRSPWLTGAVVAVLALGGCASETTTTTEDDAPAAAADELRVTRSFVARGTGYYPDSSALEGGFVDRRGKRLYTLQQFLAGTAPYVSVAMDSSAFAYGTRLRIHELDARYGESIVFRVVDTGGAFKGKGTTRIDICTANNKASLEATINGTLHIDALASGADE